MVVIIDNYDSFVYNLARYFVCLGHKTYVVRNDAIKLVEIENLAATHIVISPGPCTPNEAGISLEVIANFYDKIPILGVCLGHQAIGQFFGAEVKHAKLPLHGQARQIEHCGTGIFRELPQQLMVARYHSLIVDHLPRDSQLLVTACSEEGEIMAVQHIKYPVYGVQFHPESILTEYGMEMVTNFLDCN